MTSLTMQCSSCALPVVKNPVTFCHLLHSDHILSSVTWVTDERIAVQWLTRKQNYLVVQIYDFDGSSWKETQVAVFLFDHLKNQDVCSGFVFMRIRLSNCNKCPLSICRNSSKEARQAGSAV